MIAVNLDTLDKVQKLVRVCYEYKNKFNIDMIYGRYIVDASSILGVSSLLGHIVSIRVSDESHNDYSEFESRIKQLSGCY